MSKNQRSPHLNQKEREIEGEAVVKIRYVKTEDYDYLYQVKESCEDVDIRTDDERTEEFNASYMALFFNKVSGWPKGDVTKDLNFENADDVMTAFSKCKISKINSDICRYGNFNPQ